VRGQREAYCRRCLIQPAAARASERSAGAGLTCCCRPMAVMLTGVSPTCATGRALRSRASPAASMASRGVSALSTTLSCGWMAEAGTTGLGLWATGLLLKQGWLWVSS